MIFRVKMAIGHGMAKIVSADYEMVNYASVNRVLSLPADIISALGLGDKLNADDSLIVDVFVELIDGDFEVIHG